MNKISFALLATLGLLNSICAQDTLTIMTYNLLNYPSQQSSRYNDLKEIIQYSRPDIFICNELDSDAGANLLLTNAFNVAPVNYYAKASFYDGPDTDNMLFYNSGKLTLTYQYQIVTALRDISHYRLFSCAGLDTVWFDVFSAHLKAGSTFSDETARSYEANNFCNYNATLPANTNIILGGDFNLYSSSEPAWSRFTTNCTHNLNDPINMTGAWHANVIYKNIHTQSTRSSSSPGCCGGTTGGLDDRFDFLLINDHLKNGSAGAQYISGSYLAIGNDGNHYNKALTDAPTNSSVPANVATALFNMSDHLPVLMKVLTCDVTIGLEDLKESIDFGIYLNQDQLSIHTNFNFHEPVLIEITDINGQILVSEIYDTYTSANQFMINLPFLSHGLYIVRLSNSEGVGVRKFVR